MQYAQFSNHRYLSQQKNIYDNHRKHHLLLLVRTIVLGFVGRFDGVCDNRFYHADPFHRDGSVRQHLGEGGKAKSGRISKDAYGRDESGI